MKTPGMKKSRMKKPVVLKLLSEGGAGSEETDGAAMGDIIIT